MFSLLRLERKQTNSSDPLRIRIFFFLSYSFGIETINTFMHSHSSPEHYHPLPNQNGQSVYPFSDQNGAKTLPGGAAHTYIAYIREYPPGFFQLLRDFVPKKWSQTGTVATFAATMHCLLLTKVLLAACYR